MDISITKGGDFEIGYDSDLAVKTAGDEIADDVLFRVRTYLGDFSLHEDLGTQLEDYIGRPNSRDTLDAMSAEIKNALTYDGFLLSEEVTVTAIPVSLNEAVFAIRVYVQDLAAPVVISVPFSWREGFLQIP